MSLITYNYYLTWGIKRDNYVYITIFDHKWVSILVAIMSILSSCCLVHHFHSSFWEIICPISLSPARISGSSPRSAFPVDSHGEKSNKNNARITSRQGFILANPTLIRPVQLVVVPDKVHPVGHKSRGWRIC